MHAYPKNSRKYIFLQPFIFYLKNNDFRAFNYKILFNVFLEKDEKIYVGLGFRD